MEPCCRRALTREDLQRGLPGYVRFGLVPRLPGHLLEGQAPDLHTALERAKSEGLAYLVLDGKVVDSDRVRETKISRKGREIDAWYSGKTGDFGGLVEALMAPGGVPLWVSEVRPGSVHEITAARELVLAMLSPYLPDLPVLADGGYEGAGHGVYNLA